MLPAIGDFFAQSLLLLFSESDILAIHIADTLEASRVLRNERTLLQQGQNIFRQAIAASPLADIF